jgi:rhomboid protease GluP
MVIMCAGIVGYAFTLDDFDADQYNKNLAKMQKQETQALELFEMDDNAAPRKIVNFIKDAGIPAWEACLSTLTKMDKMEGLSADLKRQNEILRGYCLLRIESYRLIEKANSEGTDRYNNEIEVLNRKIEEEIAKL